MNILISGMVSALSAGNGNAARPVGQANVHLAPAPKAARGWFTVAVMGEAGPTGIRTVRHVSLLSYLRGGR